MFKHILRVKNLVSTATAKDTLILFVGNSLSAFLGFVFVFFVARLINKEDAGIFFAVTNLAVMITSLADIGISSGVVNFISESVANGKNKLAEEFTKAAFTIRLALILVLVAITFILSPIISPRLLATNNISASFWVGSMIVAFFLWTFLPYVLQARKRFLAAVVIDNVFMVVRLVILFILVYFGGATLTKIFSSYIVAGIASGVVGLYAVSLHFLRTRPSKDIYKKLTHFSGWMGISRVTSSISGSLDVQMMAALLGALPTAIYSIPSKLASFIVVLSGSFSAVTATRFAGFGDRHKERSYMLKSTLAMLVLVIGIIVWIIIAKPFILLLFPSYSDSVPVFRLLALANIPFILATPAVTAIIYALKKPKFVGVFSVFQLFIMFILDVAFIPRFGVLGPAITLGIVNTLLAIYSWLIVMKHFR